MEANEPVTNVVWGGNFLIGGRLDDPKECCSGNKFMYDSKLSSTVEMNALRIYPMLAPLSFAGFAGALVTDLVYWRSPDAMWATFSIWLITAGLVMAGFAALAGVIDFVRNRSSRALEPAWLHLLGNALALILALINAFVHSRDGYTAVVPTGLILSGVVVVILIFTVWMGSENVFRRRIGAVN
jgi:uncharacterized membrane protein